MTAPSPTPRTVAGDARHPALAKFVLEHAVSFGTFKLTSGRTSDYYCDAKQVSFHPRGITLVADAVLDELGSLDVDAVGGMDMGATPIVSAVAMRSETRGRPIVAFVVRKESKGHGLQRQIEGCLPSVPSRVLVVDDVITTGGSTVKAIEVIREHGHEVALVTAILDRMAGGAEAMAQLGVPYRPLVTVRELGLASETAP